MATFFTSPRPSEYIRQLTAAVGSQINSFFTQSSISVSEWALSNTRPRHHGEALPALPLHRRNSPTLLVTYFQDQHSPQHEHCPFRVPRATLSSWMTEDHRTPLFPETSSSPQSRPSEMSSSLHANRNRDQRQRERKKIEARRISGKDVALVPAKDESNNEGSSRLPTTCIVQRHPTPPRSGSHLMCHLEESRIR